MKVGPIVFLRIDIPNNHGFIIEINGNHFVFEKQTGIRNGRNFIKKGFVQESAVNRIDALAVMIGMRSIIYLAERYADERTVQGHICTPMSNQTGTHLSILIVQLTSLLPI